MMTDKLQECLARAEFFAKNSRHAYLTAEHLLVSLIEDKKILSLFKKLGCDVEMLRGDLNEFFEKSLLKESCENPVAQAIPTLVFQRIIEEASEQTASAGKNHIDCYFVLVSIFRENQCAARYFLEKQGVKLYDVMFAASHEDVLLDKKGHDTHSSLQVVEPSNNLILKDFKTSEMDECSYAIIGREDKLSRLHQVLNRKINRSVIIVGEKGVGKSSLIKAFAYDLFRGNVSDKIKHAKLKYFDVTYFFTLLKSRHDIEKIFSSMLSSLDIDSHILIIDDLHIVFPNLQSGGSSDYINQFFGFIKEKSFRFICSMTTKEYKKISDNSLVSDTLELVKLEELSEEDSLKVISSQKSQFELYHQVVYSESFLYQAIRLAKEIFPEKKLPMSAFSLLDDIGSIVSSKKDRCKIISSKDIEEFVSLKGFGTGRSLSAQSFHEIKKNLKKVIFGQNEAVDILVNTIQIEFAGLGSKDKPIGSFLFYGPTGVGKTELSKQLASVLGLKLLRFDMSEYMEKHTVARFIGAPPGYIGYGEGGQLTEAICSNPNSILLLDEIEKAHSDIHNILLQVMDSGRLTDSSGRCVDFKNVVLILTSNVGSKELVKYKIGFDDNELCNSSSAREMSKAFSPEFVNRFDSLIAFSNLCDVALENIVNNHICSLSEQLKEKNINFRITKNAKKSIVSRSRDDAFGARPVVRYINNYLKKKIADEIIFGELQKGGSVFIDVENNDLIFSFNGNI